MCLFNLSFLLQLQLTHAVVAIRASHDCYKLSCYLVFKSGFLTQIRLFLALNEFYSSSALNFFYFGIGILSLYIPLFITGIQEYRRHNKKTPIVILHSLKIDILDSLLCP